MTVCFVKLGFLLEQFVCYSLWYSKSRYWNALADIGAEVKSEGDDQAGFVCCACPFADGVDNLCSFVTFSGGVLSDDCFF